MELLNVSTISLLDYLRLGIVFDSYFDGSLKPHTLDAHSYGQFFSVIEATNGLGRQSFKVQVK